MIPKSEVTLKKAFTPMLDSVRKETRENIKELGEIMAGPAGYYEQLSDWADFLDRILSSAAEDLENGRPVGHINDFLHDVSRPFGEFYPPESAIDPFESYLRDQAGLIATLADSREIDSDTLEKIEDRFDAVLDKWHDWKIEHFLIFDEIERLFEIEDKRLDMSLNSAFGAYDTHGTYDNPLMNIIRDFKACYSDICRRATISHLAQDELLESLYRFQRAVCGREERKGWIMVSDTKDLEEILGDDTSDTMDMSKAPALRP